MQAPFQFGIFRTARIFHETAKTFITKSIQRMAKEVENKRKPIGLIAVAIQRKFFVGKFFHIPMCKSVAAIKSCVELDCAERVALFRALTDGKKKFVAVAVVARCDGGPMPCGACRQLLAEYAPDAKVFIADSDALKKVKT